MGWYGYGNYDGDVTQTQHIDFLKWAKVVKTDDQAMDCFSEKRTILSKEQKLILKKNVNLILKRLPKIVGDEDWALQWQMLVALLVDNGIKPNRIIKIKFKEACNILLGEHSDTFENPSQRRKAIRNLMSRVKNVRN